MTQFDRSIIENLVRELLSKELQTGFDNGRDIAPSGVMAIDLPIFDVTEENRLDTGNPNDRVYTRDLMSTSESPRLGCGLMVMEDTTFEWHVGYDEIDYIIEGSLTIISGGKKTTAHPGQLLYIPKDSDIQFSVEGKARFLYITYPADWQG